MADDYLSDDERAEALKLWWRENWAWMVAGVVLGVGLLLGWQYYQRYVQQRAESASAALTEYATTALTDKAKASTLLNDLTGKYKATPYSLQAQLLQAQYAVEAGDLATAAKALRAVADSNMDAELALVAKVRLARVLIEQKQFDEALSLLEISKMGAFAAEAHEVRGDALYQKQDQAGAIKEYQAALAAHQTAGTSNSVLELKLTDLGVEVSTASAATSSEAAVQ